MSQKKAVVYSNLPAGSFSLRPPRQNRDGKSMSAISIDKTHIQLGDAASLNKREMSCVFRGIVEVGRSKAANIQILDDDILSWVCDKEAEMAVIVHKHSLEWFGKAMDLQDTRRMIASVLSRDVVAVKCAEYVDTWKLKGEDDCDSIDIHDVEPGSYVTPIVRFDGLYIGEQHFSCSFTVTSMLVGNVRPEEDPLSHFVRQTEEEEDISDPLLFASEGSGHSFDTKVHAQHMTTFDL